MQKQKLTLVQPLWNVILIPHRVKLAYSIQGSKVTAGCGQMDICGPQNASL